MSNIVEPTIEITQDGSQTLLHPLLGDHYHSTRGAVGEAMHIFIEHGLRATLHERVAVFEAGFGSGLNAYLTMQEAERSGRRVEYTSVELYPVAMNTVMRLELAADPQFVALHTAAWGERVEITPNFSLFKLEADLTTVALDERFDVVYFDAFAPESQPELWSREVFRRIAKQMTNGAILVTYSAKGVVKQALRDEGLDVVRLKGALGKRHMIKAIKNDIL